jgi:hypothetical protein
VLIDEKNSFSATDFFSVADKIEEPITNHKIHSCSQCGNKYRQAKGEYFYLEKTLFSII